jgi:hypothetical protein
LKTDISYLPKHKQAELKSIVAALIPRYFEIELIILFGSYSRNQQVEDTYIENGITVTTNKAISIQKIPYLFFEDCSFCVISTKLRSKKCILDACFSPLLTISCH